MNPTRPASEADSLQVIDQLAAAGHHQALGHLTQRDFDQRRRFEIHVQQVGHQPADLRQAARRVAL